MSDFQRKTNVYSKFDLPTLIATVAGVGCLTTMPGTVASVLACLLYILLPIHPLLILVTAAAGIWAGNIYSREKGVTDPSEVVIDEVVGMWLSLYALSGLSLVMAAFFLFRIMDILKPFPVSAAEKLPGGLGIMADDVVAGFMTNIIIRVLLRFFV